MRVYLTGFMGAGKSTVGGLLARELDCEFVDLDAEIEADQRLPVLEIFARLGESRFRELEDAQLRLTERRERCVVATGGGTPVAAENRRWMRTHGSIVWLRADFERLRARLNDASERPLWKDKASVRQLFEGRLEGYEDCDWAIETATKTAREVAFEVAETLATAGLR